MSNVKKGILLRVRIAFLIMLGFAALIVFRLISLQYMESGDQWRAKAKARQVDLKTIKAMRGNIYSDDGSLLATSIPKYQLAFDPSVYYNYCKERGQLSLYKIELDSLTDLLGAMFTDRGQKGYEEKIKRIRENGGRYVRLGNHLLKYQEKKSIEQWPIFREGRMRGGLIFERSEKRARPFGILAQQTIGYVREEIVDGEVVSRTARGLENSFDSLLAGLDGEAWFEKYSGGKWKPIHNSEEIEPVNGYDIESTINVNLQDVAHEALLRKLHYTKAQDGCVIVMEVATGEIKAIVNLKRHYRRDSSIYYAEGNNFALVNRADPGSTFKLASMMAVLEENENLRLNDSIDTEKGRWKIYDHTIRDDHRHKQWLTIQEIIEMSSNVGVAKLTNQEFGRTKASQQRFVDYVNYFGLKEGLEFQIKGARSPNVKTPDMDSWSGISLAQMSIGYELEMIPLQMLTFYNAIANNGKMITPIIVKNIRTADRVIQTVEPTILSDSICSSRTLKMLQTSLEGVVQRGTARNIRSRNYKIAGKTGTAQKIINGRYVEKYYTSFAGYFPAQSPKYSMIVVVDNPMQNGKYGAQVAAPVFKEIADKIYARDISLHPEFVQQTEHEGIYPVVQAGNYLELKSLLDAIGVKTMEQDFTTDWVRAKINSKHQAVDWKSNQVLEKLTPNVKGMRLRDALYLLENAGLKVEFEGEGRVVKQSQIPGRKILVGSTIKLMLG